MSKLFIHNPLFRLFSPIFSGVVIYLLILLINNNVEQLSEQFLGEELYVCIGLSFIIQEFSRFLLLTFNKLPLSLSPILKFLFQIIVSMVLCSALVTLTLTLYFKYILGYSPSSYELWVFNSIFCCITFIYVLLHISHQYLYKINTNKIKYEHTKKQLIEDDFMQFKKGVNPNLLFECFEAIIVLIRQKSDRIDDIVDNIAMVYRYILSKKNEQLVSIDEELNALNELAQLFNHLPFMDVKINNEINSIFLVVPGSLLSLVENIIRTTINDADNQLQIDITETNNHITLNYVKNDKIITGFNANLLRDINTKYAIYNEECIVINENEFERIISIPKLITANNL